MKVFENICDLIGKTPLIKLPRLTERLLIKSNLFIKLEKTCPGGSIKDRTVKYIIEEAERRGDLTADSTIIEPTSGNTGIGIAMISAVKGYPCVIVMPDTMSIERQRLMEAYGAKVVRTDGALGMTGSIKEAERIAASTPNSFILGQFTNPDNPKAHSSSTAPEIFSDTDGEVDIVVAGIGTGGTITGIAEYLKAKKPDVKIIGVEPEKSPVLTKGVAGAHAIQGIGAGFVPEILNLSLIDEIITVSDEDAVLHTKMLARLEGVLVGLSAGAALAAAIKVAKDDANVGKTIVVILPDSGERYLSLGIL